MKFFYKYIKIKLKIKLLKSINYNKCYNTKVYLLFKLNNILKKIVNLSNKIKILFKTNIKIVKLIKTK